MRRQAKFALGLVLGLFGSIGSLHSQESFGSFQGELIVKALPGGRNLELTHPFAYIDPNGKLWGVPTGTIVDGASIPQAFWSIIGGPFEDKYREASVIHDYNCEQKSETWENVHLAFYNGMRARDVSPLKAKLMYAAVYNFGPRWIGLNSQNSKVLISGQPVLLDTAKEAILHFIAENDPSLPAIQEMSEKLTQVQNIEQLEKILYKHSNCTPILGNTANPTVKETLILCGLSAPSKKQAALRNLRSLNAQLKKLLAYQRVYLPLVEDYLQSPTPEKWEIVKQWSRDVYGLVKVSIRSVLDLDDPKLQSMAPQLDDVFGVLTQRARMISPIISGQQMEKNELLRWTYEYRRLVDRLQGQLAGLENRLSEMAQ